MNNKNNDKSIRTIETNGVEQIPDNERTATPKDLPNFEAIKAKLGELA